MNVKTARKYLPTRLKKLSDEELENMIGQLEILAEIFIDTYEKSGSKKQLGVIDSKMQKNDNRN